MAKKKSTRAGNVWQPGPDDAIRLAALRWFALELERMSIEIYASDKSQYAAMEKTLRTALKAMGATRKRIRVNLSDECPNGYVLCKDGLCAPMCDGIVDAASNK